MVFQRVTTTTIPSLRWCSSALGRTCVNSRIRIDRKYLQNQMLCHKVWQRTPPLRGYFTKSANKTFTRSTPMKLIVQISSFLEGKSIKWLCVRHKYKYTVKDSEPLKGMNPLLRTTTAALRATSSWPKIFSVTVTGTATMLYVFYLSKCTKNPLSGRKRFMIQTDEEAFQRSEMISTRILKDNVSVETTLDRSGKPTDTQTKRVDRIMSQLRSKNPELDKMLIPGGSWRPVVIKSNKQISWRCGMAFTCGRILLAGDVLSQLDDDEIGFLLAHEMAHVVMQHENEVVGSNIFFYHYFHTVLKKIKEISSSFDIEYYIEKYNEKLTVPLNSVFEWEADEFGFEFAAKACFDYRKFGNALETVGTLVDQAMAALLEGDDLDVADEPDEGGAYDSWDEEVYRAVVFSDVWLFVKHPLLWKRVTVLRSQDYQAKAQAFRAMSNCFPLPTTPVKTIQALSQKVDELTASRQVKSLDIVEPALD